MPIEVSKVTAPAHWASYLINGDASGFDYSNTPGDKAGDRDKAECDRWLAWLTTEGWRVVSTDDNEPIFRRSNDAGTLAGDCLTYIVHRDFEIPDLDDDRVLRYVKADEHRLLTWDLNQRDSLGKHAIGYAFYAPGDDAPLFFGRDYYCAPSHAIDSDDCLRSLLGFLTLRPGDTDCDYFADYTDRQLAWCDKHAEALQLYGMEPESDFEPPAFVDID